MVLSPKSCGTTFWSIADIPRKGEEIRALGASQMSLEELHAVLQTPSIVPFPCEIQRGRSHTRLDADVFGVEVAQAVGLEVGRERQVACRRAG